MNTTLKTLPPLDAAQRYTIDEACTYLRTSRARLYAKVRAGELRVIKDGRRSYVPGTELISQSRA